MTGQIIVVTLFRIAEEVSPNLLFDFSTEADPDLNLMIGHLPVTKNGENLNLRDLPIPLKLLKIILRMMKMMMIFMA